jgi:HAMP domain-containing protein
MRLTHFPWHSLKTRVTFFTLVIFLISIWTLAFYVSRMVRENMQNAMGVQQSSTVAFVASAINQELEERLQALEVQAALITPAMLRNTAATQAFLEHHPLFQNQFNVGSFITRMDGIVIADVPVAQKRIGLNVMDRDYFIAALKEDRSSVGRPVIGKNLGTPLFAMAAPIRDAQRKVIGALVGVTELGKPNILDKVAGNRYGETGGYVLVDPKHRIVVTATDKSRIMTALPPPGVNSLVDRFIGGYEGYDITVNPLGQEVLAAAKAIPVAGWYVVVSLPTAEAFVTIRDMQQRMLIVAIFLSLLAAFLTWWILNQQLSPMLAAVRALATMSETKQHTQALPITRDDEIGKLIAGFNRLLKSLGQSEAALKESEFRWKFAIEGSGDGLWDWNVANGTVFFSPPCRPVSMARPRFTATNTASCARTATINGYSIVAWWSAAARRASPCA